MRSDLWLSAAYLQRRHHSAALRALVDFLQTRVGARARAGALGFARAIGWSAACAAPPHYYPGNPRAKGLQRAKDLMERTP